MPESNNKLDREFLKNVRNLDHLKDSASQETIDKIKELSHKFPIIEKFDTEFLKDLEDNKHLVVLGGSREAIAVADKICSQVKINHQPVQPRDELPELIICAAAKDPETNKVYMSMRHGDEMFWQQLDAEYTHGDKNCCHFEQGFYTNKRRFVSREDAYIIAEQNNQIKRLCPTGSKRLYSEMLY